MVALWEVTRADGYFILMRGAKTHAAGGLVIRFADEHRAQVYADELNKIEGRNGRENHETA
jgi:hypothetical protein